MIQDSHEVVTGSTQRCVAHPQEELNILINMWSFLVYVIRKPVDGVDPTLDNQIVGVSKIGLHQTE